MANPATKRISAAIGARSWVSRRNPVKEKRFEKKTGREAGSEILISLHKTAIKAENSSKRMTGKRLKIKKPHHNSEKPDIKSKKVQL
ncbi:hypothetical protein [Flavobacterium sp. LC2016-01]|uniref:hypothetical protein n=1 Tax=Flavobacterium sp. LC2016-01 TaxID=2675876 RepID=UPI0012BAEDD3|nr:hypothetical protein [Flavobacterium sp. LC2016-01]MTH16150.1 hypothetical protein [Flavobacterium sp. LC2016-01]